MKKIAFSLDNVSLERDGKFILRDLSFTVGEGERWVVFGPNGSGKTSLLRIASFYLHPSIGWAMGRYQLERTTCPVAVRKSKAE